MRPDLGNCSGTEQFKHHLHQPIIYKASAALPDLPRNLIEGIAAGTNSVSFTDLSPAQQTLAVKAIVSTIENIFIMIPVAGGVVLLLSLFMSRKRVNLRPE